MKNTRTHTTVGSGVLDVLRHHMVVLARTKTNTPVGLSPPSGRERRPATPSRRVRRATQDEIVVLYNQGMSTRQVALKTGISKTTVLAVLECRGVAMRSPHRH